MGCLNKEIKTGSRFVSSAERKYSFVTVPRFRVRLNYDVHDLLQVDLSELLSWILSILEQEFG